MGEQEKEVTVKLRMVEPGDKPVPLLYSNFVQVNHTPWDFTLHFGNFSVPPEKPTLPKGATEVQLEVKAVARITVSTGLIKMLLKALQENIARYESTYGTIREAKED